MKVPKSREAKNMEKKTIGQFISVLRKANGMTQQELDMMIGIGDI